MKLGSRGCDVQLFKAAKATKNVFIYKSVAKTLPKDIGKYFQRKVFSGLRQQVHQ